MLTAFSPSIHTRSTSALISAFFSCAVASAMSSRMSPAMAQATFSTSSRRRASHLSCLL